MDRQPPRSLHRPRSGRGVPTNQLEARLSWLRRHHPRRHELSRDAAGHRGQARRETRRSEEWRSSAHGGVRTMAETSIRDVADRSDPDRPQHIGLCCHPGRDARYRVLGVQPEPPRVHKAGVAELQLNGSPETCGLRGTPCLAGNQSARQSARARSGSSCPAGTLPVVRQTSHSAGVTAIGVRQPGAVVCTSLLHSLCRGCPATGRVTLPLLR